MWRKLVSGTPCRSICPPSGRYCSASTPLVGILTALVYEGSGVVHRTNTGLAQWLARDGFTSVAGAVGVDNR
jgi:dihydroorotate dehydrogenase